MICRYSELDMVLTARLLHQKQWRIATKINRFMNYRALKVLLKFLSVIRRLNQGNVIIINGVFLPVVFAGQTGQFHA